MEVGDKLICLKTVNNYIGNPLFIKGEEYEVLHIIENDNDSEDVTLNHIMYANTYNSFDIEWVKENFISKKEIRINKINSIL